MRFSEHDFICRAVDMPQLRAALTPRDLLQSAIRMIMADDFTDVNQHPAGYIQAVQDRYQRAQATVRADMNAWRKPERSKRGPHKKR